jgi:opacity protein-like surface antigen
MSARMSQVLRAALLLLFLGGVATPASADWLLTPYLGVVFGGSSNTVDLNDFDDEFEQRLNFGGSATWMGQGIIGFEVDFNMAPNFFQTTAGGDDFDILDLDSSVQTLMGNLVVGIPVGGSTGPGVRPYATGGIGLMRANLDSATDLFDNLSTNELGLNLGGGAHVFFNDNIGIRGDLRYFRGLQGGDDDDDDLDLEDFDYWRGTFGVTFRFGG